MGCLHLLGLYSQTDIDCAQKCCIPIGTGTSVIHRAEQKELQSGGVGENLYGHLCLKPALLLIVWEAFVATA